MKPLLAAILFALVAGCASPHEDPQWADESAVSDPSALDGAGTPRHFANDFELHGTGANACTLVVDPEVMNEVNWVSVIVGHARNDTHVAVRFDWDAVNPTADAIRFRVTDAPTFQGNILDQWDGVSHQVRDFDAEELATLPDPFYVEASLTGCPPEGLAGVHVNPKGAMEQPVHFQISWNGHAFES